MNFRQKNFRHYRVAAYALHGLAFVFFLAMALSATHCSNVSFTFWACLGFAALAIAFWSTWLWRKENKNPN
jgi:hypothetical protein